MVYKRTFKSL